MLVLLTVSNTFYNLERFRLSRLLSATVFQKVISLEKRKHLTDDQCIKLIANGNEEPFVEIFDRYSDLVFGYCMKILKDRSQAEDASQEVWVKLIKNAKLYDGRGKFRAWLLQISRNTCFSIFREIKKNKAEDITDYEVKDFSQKDILNLITENEDLSKLKKCIDSLPENQRIALIIWMTEDLSYEQIAAELNTSISAIKSLLFRSRQTLKEMMDSNG